MSELDLMAMLPDVTSAVMGDLSGTHHESYQEPEGEAVAAVAGLVASTLLQAGEQLGLGALKSISVSGPARARVILLRSHLVLTGTIEPARSLGEVEKALERAD
jgi:predicted regulator of Ras-like GTPase activity (Roadblock/LC7/MglB family)